MVMERLSELAVMVLEWRVIEYAIGVALSIVVLCFVGWNLIKESREMRQVRAGGAAGRRRIKERERHEKDEA